MSRLPALTEGDLLALLKKRLEPAHLVLAHVGFGGRVADAVSIGLWRSRGMGLHAYEMKCQRRDWLMEMRNPAKAEPSAAYMDTFTLVINDDKVALDEEVPDPWGILVARSGRLFERRKAQRMTPKPVDRTLLVTLVRRAVWEHDDGEQARAVREAENRGRENGYAAGQKAAREAVSGERERYAEQTSALREFERLTGLDLTHRWQIEETAALARWLREHEGGRGVLWGLQQIVRGAEQVQEAVASLPKGLLPPRR